MLYFPAWNYPERALVCTEFDSFLHRGTGEIGKGEGVGGKDLVLISMVSQEILPELKSKKFQRKRKGWEKDMFWIFFTALYQDPFQLMELKYTHRYPVDLVILILLILYSCRSGWRAVGELSRYCWEPSCYHFWLLALWFRAEGKLSFEISLEPQVPSCSSNRPHLWASEKNTHFWGKHNRDKPGVSKNAVFGWFNVGYTWVVWECCC